jgi:hypothetical protein
MTTFRTISAVAAAAALAITAGCSSSSSDSEAGTVERIVFSDGSRLHLASFDGTTLTSIATAEIPPGSTRVGQSIMGILKHPTKPWLYVPSTVECPGVGNCWGNGRIDRFLVSRGALTWASGYDYAASAGTDCALNDDCAPIDGTFSASGDRLYMQNDSDDDIEIFGVDPDGALTMLSTTGNNSAYLHGVAVDPTGVNTYVYNGGMVFSVAGDVGAPVTTTVSGGNSTRVIPRAGADWLLTTVDTNAFGMYSLADPADPQPISTTSDVVLGTNQSRALALNGALNRVLVTGRNHLGTYGWDGTSFSPEASFDPRVGSTTIENRAVTFVGGDSRAAISWFVVDSAAPSGVSGGVSIYGIDPSGAITTLGTVTTSASARSVISIKL